MKNNVEIENKLVFRLKKKIDINNAITIKISFQ